MFSTAIERSMRAGTPLCRLWKAVPSLSVTRYASNDHTEAISKSPNSKLQEVIDKHKQVQPLPNKPFIPLNYRFLYPEFLPDTGPEYRHHVREILERQDMLKRRKILEIPEFYVGSILAVTCSDKFAPGKINRFVGICIQRIGYGLRAKFVLRNFVDSQGVEIAYDLYNPTIRKIEVLKLEKRLDGELFYLRDALPEYSTFPFDMEPVLHPEGAPVPVNPIKVKLRPKPWYKKWEKQNLQGVQELELSEKDKMRAKKAATPWEKYDLMKEYRGIIPEEEQQEIYQEVYSQEQQMSSVYKKAKRKQIRTDKSSRQFSNQDYFHSEK
ncbi:mitochondrial 54S ribosomal protein YmL19 [Chamberlinius hualienensis]